MTGKLDFVIVRLDRGRLRLAPLLQKYKKGQHLGLPMTKYINGSRLEIHSDVLQRSISTASASMSTMLCLRSFPRESSLLCLSSPSSIRTEPSAKRQENKKSKKALPDESRAVL